MTAKMVRAGGDSGPFYVWRWREVRRGLKALPSRSEAVGQTGLEPAAPPFPALGRKPERGCGGSTTAAGDFRERD